MITSFAPSSGELDKFKRIQRLAYDCAEAVGAALQPGMTERDAAAMMTTWLEARGVDDWFHRPFAWFGDRTAFRGFIGFRHLGGFNPAFYPSARRLEKRMPFILDCAPSWGGCTADIGYCGSVGEHPLLERLMDDLLGYRILILDLVRQRRRLSEVSEAVDARCALQGYEPRHKAYPFQVLAHRVERLADDGAPQHRSLLHFGLRSVRELVRSRIRGAREGWSPLWSSASSSDHPPTPGLWAVEPHLGFRGVGAKWEELLVITDSDAFWLDDDVPHVRRWQRRGLWPAVQRAA